MDVRSGFFYRFCHIYCINILSVVAVLIKDLQLQQCVQAIYVRLVLHKTTFLALFVYLLSGFIYILLIVSQKLTRLPVKYLL